MTLDVAYIVTAILLWIFHWIKFENHKKWHSYCIAGVVGIYGWTLMHHHPHSSGREPIEGIHELGGQFAILAAIFRACDWFILAGIFAIIHAILFIWSNPSATAAWVRGFGYPGMSYVALVMLLGVLVAAINGILFGIREKYKQANVNNGDKIIYGKRDGIVIETAPLKRSGAGNESEDSDDI